MTHYRHNVTIAITFTITTAPYQLNHQREARMLERDMRVTEFLEQKNKGATNM